MHFKSLCLTQGSIEDRLEDLGPDAVERVDIIDLSEPTAINDITVMVNEYMEKAHRGGDTKYDEDYASGNMVELLVKIGPDWGEYQNLEHDEDRNMIIDKKYVGIWDWYSIGGRYSNCIVVKKDSSTYNYNLKQNRIQLEKFGFSENILSMLSMFCNDAPLSEVLLMHELSEEQQNAIIEDVTNTLEEYTHTDDFKNNFGNGSAVLNQYCQSMVFDRETKKMNKDEVKTSLESMYDCYYFIDDEYVETEGDYDGEDEELSLQQHIKDTIDDIKPLYRDDYILTMVDLHN